MIEVIMLAAVLVVVIGGYLLFRYLKNRKINEIIPYAYGNTTMFMRRYEIVHFEGLGRKEKRRIVNTFQAKIDRGLFIPIYKKGALIGYVPKR